MTEIKNIEQSLVTHCKRTKLFDHVTTGDLGNAPSKSTVCMVYPGPFQPTRQMSGLNETSLVTVWQADIFQTDTYIKTNEGIPTDLVDKAYTLLGSIHTDLDFTDLPDELEQNLMVDLFGIAQDRTGGNIFRYQGPSGDFWKVELTFPVIIKTAWAQVK